MKAVTIWQPWAWAIAAGHKPVVNRTWSPLGRIQWGERIAIHAAKRRMEDGDLGRVRYLVGGALLTWKDLEADLDFGAVIATADFVAVARAVRERGMDVTEALRV